MRHHGRESRDIDNRTVTRAIGRVVWPWLRESGFEAFTGRNAWRYANDEVDVVNFQSYGGMLADSVGCTSFSFQVNVGLWRPGDALSEPRDTDQSGRLRPQEYECEPHRRTLRKGVAQPWFEPFSRDVSRWPRSFRLHRAALKHVFGAQKRDNPYVWFVLADGSNLDECVGDAVEALNRDGLPWLEALRS